jgi:hypothetical protein
MMIAAGLPQEKSPHYFYVGRLCCHITLSLLLPFRPLPWAAVNAYLTYGTSAQSTFNSTESGSTVVP